MSYPKLFSTMRAAALLAVAPLLMVSGGAGAHELPVGDGHVTDHPQAGNVYACRTTFRGGGARHTGAWFHGDTWNPAEKPHVQGRVMWSDAMFSAIPSGDELAIESNGLPVGEPTGIFPIGYNDPAYAYDTNPNRIERQDLAFDIPLTPQRATSPSCLPMGMIGVTTTGVAIYSAVDDAGRDAAAHEVQDLCDGHPQGKGQYHYHSGSPCLPGENADKLVGWALDGYPIFGMRDARGKLLTNADLDACHGRGERVSVNGRDYDYVYRLTQEYPYTLGCFSGEVQRGTRRAIHREMGPPRRRPGPPPPPF